MRRQWAITIKHPFVEKIVSGVKAYEIRTRIPCDLKAGDKVFVVQAASGGKIVLSFTVRSIVEGNPERLWECFNKDLGVVANEFFLYTRYREIVYLIEMESIERLSPPWTLEDLGLSWVPQWFTSVKVCENIPHSAPEMPVKSAVSDR